MIAVISPEQLEQTICLSGCLRPVHPSCIPVFQLFQAFAISRANPVRTWVRMSNTGIDALDALARRECGSCSHDRS